MKKIIILMIAFTALSGFCADFSPEELVGKYESKDKKVVVTVNKNLVAAPTLFDPAKYSYDIDIKFFAGECMKMYGSNPFIESKRLKLDYNGSWKPTEYLTATYYEDNPGYDGYVWVNEANFRATKKLNESGATSISLAFDFSISHTPDYSDGEDGGEQAFEDCYDKTKTYWDELVKVN